MSWIIKEGCTYSNNLSQMEKVLLEADIFTRVTQELKEVIRSQNESYFRTLKITCEKENMMIESDLIRYLANDILSSEEYSISGIAYYTDTPEEVIFEIVSGKNTKPTLYLSQKIINLHRAVRPSLYSKIMNKIQNNNSGSAALQV